MGLLNNAILTLAIANATRLQAGDLTVSVNGINYKHNRSLNNPRI